MRIDTAAGRKRLPVRKEVYYYKVDKGKHIGYRKGKTGGSWWARLTVNQQRAFQQLEFKSSDPQKEWGVALKLAQEWFKLQEQGVNVDYAVSDAIMDYITYLEQEKSAAVFKTAQAVLKSVPASLQETPVHKLTTRQLDKWRKTFLKKGDKEQVRRSQNTSNRRWSDLRACLNRAFQQGYVADKTAWERIQPYKKAQRGRQIFWTPEEVAGLLAAAQNIDRDFYKLLQAGLLTGCRIGELRSLKVKDFAHGQLSINGKTGIRDMQLSSTSIKFCKRQAKNKTPEAWLLDYRGRQWPEDLHHKMFRKVRSMVKVDPDSTFYCARHYFISVGLQAGISADLIAKNVGTSPAMIFQFYGKFTGESQKEAAEIIDQALGI